MPRLILLYAARGVEVQTRHLFDVARARGIRLLTFVNKYDDRSGMEPLEMPDPVEATLGLTACRSAGRWADRAASAITDRIERTPEDGL